VGAGHARERVAPATRQDPRDAGSSGVRCFVSETRCNGGAFRGRSSRPWPNSSLQAPPLPRSLGSGTATGQLHPFRESARTFQFSKERRDRVGPSRTVFGQGWPKRSAARPSLQGCTRGVSRTGPPDPGAASLERKVPGILRGNLCRELRSLSRAWPAPTSQAPANTGLYWRTDPKASPIRTAAPAVSSEPNSAAPSGNSTITVEPSRKRPSSSPLRRVTGAGLR